MKPRTKTIVTIVGVAVALGLAVSLGFLAAGSVSPSATLSTAAYDMSKDAATVGAPDGGSGSIGAGEMNAATGQDASQRALTSTSDAAQRLVVMTAAMALRVARLDEAVTSVRRIAAASGSQIANLSIYTGEPSPSPVPLSEQDRTTQATGPGTADITLRIPADKLASVEKQVAALGTVLTQSIAEDDVTQEHIDLSARLKNLRAEEVRLRSFLNDATKVSEMLEVERELSRVRGEIESMQAQLTYLERQAAMATLTLTLSEPGSVVSPGSEGWGLADAVTRGVQTAASLVRAAITVIVALVPLMALVAIALIVRRFIRRRRNNGLEDADTPTE